MKHVFAALLLLLASCALAPAGPAHDVAPTVRIAAPAAGDLRALVVVLPGRGDDLAGLRASGIVEAIQRGWPLADVQLVEITLADYRQGRMPALLHSPLAQWRRDYDEVWLVGASMGGMGALLHERAYPGDVDGVVLLAPFLGDRGLVAEIAAAGLAQWQPGPAAATIDAGNYQREIWRDIQGWAGRRRGADVWLAYGVDDRLAAAMPPLASALPPGHVLARPGGHRWTVWTPAAAEIFATIAASHRDPD